MWPRRCESSLGCSRSEREERKLLQDLVNKPLEWQLEAWWIKAVKRCLNRINRLSYILIFLYLCLLLLSQSHLVGSHVGKPSHSQLQRHHDNTHQPFPALRPSSHDLQASSDWMNQQCPSDLQVSCQLCWWWMKINNWSLKRFVVLIYTVVYSAEAPTGFQLFTLIEEAGMNVVLIYWWTIT